MADSPPFADVALVLAVDASDSIEDWEWRLELDGIAAAFRDNDVHAAIATLPQGRVAVAMLIWGGSGVNHDTTGWRIVDGAGAARAFADVAEAWPRRVHGGTAMGEGVAAALLLLDAAAFAPRRRIIDVSGDGMEPLPILTEQIVMMPQARAMARKAGVTINGLVITKTWPQVLEWYETNVPEGPGAFVVQVETMHDFAPAFKMKLLRELTPELT